jgi:DNA-binding transcriptional regulator YiaG
MSEAALFRRCRKALGLSLSAMARALLIASDRNPRRWEDGTRPVSGPAWVALEYMLREAGEGALADQVAEVVEQRRIASAQHSATASAAAA